MGSIHNFQDTALATLRARLGAAEEANQDLIAFARGHSGAVASIHRAVLSAIAAIDLDALCDVVVGRWPEMLGIDAAAVAIATDGEAMHHARCHGGPIDPAIIHRAAAAIGPVEIREVARGHPLFGRDCETIRAEALIRLESSSGTPLGLLLLGQRRSPGIEGPQGFELLGFLGRSLGAMIERCLTDRTH